MLKTLFSYLFLVSVYLDSSRYSMNVSFAGIQITFDFYSYYVLFLIMLFFYFTEKGRVSLSNLRKPILLLIIIAIISFVKCIIAEYGVGLVLKQIFGTVFGFSAYYAFCGTHNFDIKKIFVMYINVTIIVCIIGISQEISYISGFTPGYDFSFFLNNFKFIYTDIGLLRIGSICSEPSHLAVAMAPAVFIAINSWANKNWQIVSKLQSIIIIMTIFLTLSVVAYMAIIISLILTLWNKKQQSMNNLILTAAVLIIMLNSIIIVYHNYPEFRSKVDDSIGVILGDQDVEDVNLSTWAIYSNLIISRESLKHNPLLGTGLGTYSENYDKYSLQTYKSISFMKQIIVNREDANSLFLRLISETGLLGILAFFYFLKKNYVNDATDDINYISSSILVLFATKLVRSGNYYLSGSMLFLILYYLCKEQSESAMKSQGEKLA